MNIWENAVITTKGRALLSKLIAGNTLDITRAVVGAGTVTPGLLLDQTSVTDEMQTISITGITFPEAGKCALTCNLRNNGLKTGYTAMQVGVFATDPNEGEILFFIAQASAGTGTIIPSESEMGNYSAEWTFYFQYGQADGVNVTVDPAAAVTQAKMEVYVQGYIEEHVNPVLDEHTAAIVEGKRIVESHEESINGERYNVDSDVAYMKDVPEDSLEAAEIVEVGGMTYKINVGTEAAPVYELRLAAVTEMESVGANLFDIDSCLTSVCTKISETEFTTSRNIRCLANVRVAPNTTYKIKCEVKDRDTVLTGLSLGVIDGKDNDYTTDENCLAEDVGICDYWKTIELTFVSQSDYVSIVGRPANMRNMMVVKSDVSTAKYIPYFRDTLAIPEAVRALDGYGESNPDDTTEYNAIKWLSNGKRIYSHKGNIVDGAWILLTKKEVTDISSLLPADNILRVQPGGTVTPINEHGYAVPSTIIYERNVLNSRASTFAVENLRKESEQFVRKNGGKMTEALDLAEGSTINGNAIYHAGNKPTAVDMGAVPVTARLFGVDANTITTEGRYFCIQCANVPSHGFLEVRYYNGNSFVPDSSWGTTQCIKQTWWNYKNAQIMERLGLYKTGILTEVEWSEWKELATTDYAVNKAGDTMTGDLRLNSGNVSYFTNSNMGGWAIGNFMNGETNGTLGFIGFSGSGDKLDSINIGVGSTPFYDFNSLAIHSDSIKYNNHDVLHTGNTNQTALVATETTPTVNGQINWTYE